jgi:hypothetical protein
LAQCATSWLDSRSVNRFAVSLSSTTTPSLEQRFHRAVLGAEHALAPALTAGRSVLRWAAAHSGLPVVVVAALSLVLAVRVARRTWHIALELAFALGILLLATRLGWIRW